ncbi:Hypothetical predicted protein, partial [Xyrichtys novacula]
EISNNCKKLANAWQPVLIFEVLHTPVVLESIQSCEERAKIRITFLKMCTKVRETLSPLSACLRLSHRMKVDMSYHVCSSTCHSSALSADRSSGTSSEGSEGAVLEAIYYQ